MANKWQKHFFLYFCFRHVKIYDVTTYQVVHTLEYHSAILSLGMDVSLIVTVYIR